MAKRYDYRVEAEEFAARAAELEGDELNDFIIGTWGDFEGGEGGALFRFCTPSGSSVAADGHYYNCGCLTQVKKGDVAYDEELTLAIQADPRVPAYPEDIDPCDVGWAIEWQEKMDKLWPGRNPDE